MSGLDRIDYSMNNMDLVENDINKVLNKENLLSVFLKQYIELRLPVYLYGCGRAIQYYLKMCDKYHILVTGIIDSVDNKVGQYCYDYQILSLDQVTQKHQNFYIIISAPAFVEIIKKILYKQVPSERIFSFDVSVDIMQNRNIEKYYSYISENKNMIVQLYNDLEDCASKSALKSILENWITYDLNCLKVIREATQYFPSFILDKMSEEEVFLDCGAFDGDTIKEFLRVKKKFKKIYAFEPDEINLEQIKKIENWVTVKEKIVLINKGVYDHSGKEFFCCANSKKMDETAHISIEEEATGFVNVVALDDMVKEPVTFIKMDIEGSEMKALEGAKRILEEFRPKLAISVYHRTEDLINIYQYLQRLNLDYKFYLRHYWDCSGTDVILFAI